MISDSVVTYEQLKVMLTRHRVQLFDVRNPDEFQAGRIPDSVNVPCEQHLISVYDVVCHNKSLKQSTSEFSYLIKYKVIDYFFVIAAMTIDKTINYRLV